MVFVPQRSVVLLYNCVCWHECLGSGLLWGAFVFASSFGSLMIFFVGGGVYQIEPRWKMSVNPQV